MIGATLFFCTLPNIAPEVVAGNTNFGDRLGMAGSGGTADNKCTDWGEGTHWFLKFPSEGVVCECATRWNLTLTEN